MPVSDVLKGLRSSSYGDTKSKDEDGPSETRSFKLSDEEMKSLGGEEHGSEVTLQVSGRVTDGMFHVTSVQGPGGGEPDVNADAEQVMAKMRPMQMQTVPSPS